MKLVVFGDSLVAGYQLQSDEAFPAQLQRALAAKGITLEVINAGVSGDTTGAGRDRLAWAVADDTDGVILELGANDFLRGLPPKVARDNLDAILAALKGKPVLIAGMRASPSLGPKYVAEFDAIFPDLAKKYGALLYPFFLEGVALTPALNLRDGIHPNAQGVGLIVKNILPKVEELIGRMQAARK